MGLRITGNDRVRERPLVGLFHQFGAQWIFQDLMTDAGEGVAFPFPRFQDVIVGLMLELSRRKVRFQMGAEKRHGVELIRVPTQPHPDKVKMIRHQAVGGAEQALPRCRMQHQFPEGPMKRRAKPAGLPQRHRKRPMNHGVSLIMFAGQPWQMESSICSLASKSSSVPCLRSLHATKRSRPLRSNRGGTSPNPP